MPNPIKPTGETKQIDTPIHDANVIQTVFEAHPPLVAWSDTAAAAVTGSATTGGHGVAGVHTKGGNGVYGKSTGNAGYFDGSVQVNGNLSLTGDIFLKGADCAEQFTCAGSRPIEPGTLVVVDERGALAESRHQYDRKVVGVVAGAGTYRPAIIMDTADATETDTLRPAGPPRVVVSLMGKVFCKADATHGAIAVGDLLTSSPTPGCAMKAADPGQAFGAVVGKALGALASGQSLIPVLIALQ